MNHLLFKLSLIVAMSLTIGFRSFCQSDPEEYKKGTVSEQLNSLEAHTRIYENFRAVREDIFQLIKKNINDSLTNAKRRINKLTSVVATLNNRIDSINNSIESTKNSLEEMTRTKNSISVLGMEVNKNTYNSIMWSILGILVFLLVIGYLTFNINRNSTIKTKKELTDLQKEFEDYRKRKNIEHEKMVMSHFNEIKKIKEERTKR
jgi:uncharacterized protein YlxW (UPF0749 family)